MAFLPLYINVKERKVMNKIIMVLLTLMVSAFGNACGGNQDSGPTAPAAAPEPPPPSLTSVEFCENVKSIICANAERCGRASLEECIIAISLQLSPCQEWTPERVCPEGSVYNGEISYLCIEPLTTVSCEKEGVPPECLVGAYCEPGVSVEVSSESI